jgi:predicted helicase
MNDVKKESKGISTNKVFEGCNPDFAGPLYLYPRVSNRLETEVIKNFEKNLSLTFTDQKQIPFEGEVCFMNSAEVRPEFRVTFSRIDIFDYFYAVLFSSFYQNKNKDAKIESREMPYPTDISVFWKLVSLGGELRQLHLLTCSLVEKYITQYPVDGNNFVDEIEYRNNKIHINKTQYFDNVPETAWQFFIGNYQPAQKWLLDRKGKRLSKEEILLYKKIIVALNETERIIGQIDKIAIE